MMPKLLIILMILFGIALMTNAAKSPPFATVDWSDGAHAALVVVISAAGIALYETLGFIVTMTLLVFTLLMVVERQNLVRAGAYSIGLTVIAWWVFGTALKSPLEKGILGF
jgi:hypothetical protein